MKKPAVSPRIMLTILFSVVVFIILVITMFIVGTIIFLMARTGVLDKIGTPNIAIPVMVLTFVSILVGTVVAAIFGHIPLKPINALVSGMERLAKGDYGARIDLGSFSLGQEMSGSFNKLAGELQNTEMLRSDFINNFSHEFKTPIVSIRGFAKLLQKGNLSDKRQREYLDIIVDESTRLADMATSVLNLSKVENQGILTDVVRFNLSEQIRNCILLLEKKWSRKRLTVIANFDEQPISANEELLKQVWINLIDNAVKFSPENGEIGISISEVSDMVHVFIKNNGPQINAGDQNRIFDKFWQADTSHASEGTGIGLSIAKRIAELHMGSISVSSSPEETVFTVRLPKE